MSPWVAVRGVGAGERVLLFVLLDRGMGGGLWRAAHLRVVGGCVCVGVPPGSGGPAVVGLLRGSVRRLYCLAGVVGLDRCRPSRGGRRFWRTGLLSTDA